MSSSTASRVATLLSVFLDGRADLGVSQIHRELGWPKSVVHRLLRALEETGFVVSDAHSRRYCLGPKALQLGLVALAQVDVRRLALPYLLALRDRTGETTTLSLRVGRERLYVEQVESLQGVRQIVQVGARAPLYLGASGKAILAFLPPADQAAVLAEARAARLLDGTPLDCERLIAELGTVRTCGYAVSLSERLAGAASVAAPVFDHTSTVLGSLSIAGVTARQNRAALEALGPEVRSVAGQLSAALGWRGRWPP